MLTFGGWDQFGQTNHCFVLDVFPNGPVCEKLVWSKPRVSGAIPRPRNDHGIYRVNANLFAAFAGWNGWNAMEDLDVLHIEPERFESSLEKCLSLSDYQDLSILCSDDSVIRCNKIVVLARSSYFRAILESDPAVCQIRVPLPRVFAEALIDFLYTDKFDPEPLDAAMLRLFMDDVVPKFAAEHRSRIAQQTMLARVHSESTFGIDMERFAWRNDAHTDVGFSVVDTKAPEPRKFRAHKAVVRL